MLLVCEQRLQEVLVSGCRLQDSNTQHVAELCCVDRTSIRNFKQSFEHFGVPAACCRRQEHSAIFSDINVRKEDQKVFQDPHRTRKYDL